MRFAPQTIPASAVGPGQRRLWQVVRASCGLEAPGMWVAQLLCARAGGSVRGAAGDVGKHPNCQGE